MKTNRIITNDDAKAFFNSSLASIEDALGTANYSLKNQTITFDFNAVLLLRFNGIRADKTYSIHDDKFKSKFVNGLLSTIEKGLTDSSDFEYVRKKKDEKYTFNIKLEKLDENHVKLYLLCIEKLLETENNLSLVSSVTGAGESMFVGNTWWNDYDHHNGEFYQSDKGPRILGVPINEDKLYNTREFQKVRDVARSVSPFYDECIENETLNYSKVRNNETDYFGGRTPALTKDEKVVWVEAYGKCLIRYPDGRPRFFIAIDIYLSDIFENYNQLKIVSSLTNKGLINSDVAVWYYQKHITEGRYYFTDSFDAMMARSNEKITNENIHNRIDKHFKSVANKHPEYKKILSSFLQTHEKIFTEKLDKYTVVVPNHIGDEPQWVELRGTVIERDENNDVVLFVGVNVDVTESFLREQELRQLRVQNERLQLAEKLAIKAGSVIVWYQDETLIEDKKYFFGNNMFETKLGLPRTKDGLVHVEDLLKSLVLGTKEDRAIRKGIIKDLRALYRNEISVIHNVLSKHQNLNTGEIYYFENSIEVEAYNNGKISLVGGIMVDVTENIKREQHIRYLANHDILSGLYNRNHFETFIHSHLPEKYSVCIFDLDGLKLINDAFGHLEGDKVIKVVAQLLKETFIENEFIARIGGDEFVVVLQDTPPEKVQELFDLFDKAVKEYNETSSIEINISRAGMVVSKEGSSFEKVFAAAENLMYRRKLNNRSSRKSKVLESIIETLNQKTEETKEHSDRLQKFAINTMKALNMSRQSEMEDMSLLCRVHDIGKITIPDQILNKPSRLTNQEFEIIKKHSEAGYKIIKNITDSDLVSGGVLSHHERFDGTGYPQGLVGEDIPLFARIISIVDAYDAMTSNRIYQPSKTKQEAIYELKRCAGTQFDPRIVEAFLTTL